MTIETNFGFASNGKRITRSVDLEKLQLKLDEMIKELA